MKISIGFSWAAGIGVNTSWLLLGQLLSAKWYTVLWDKEYASIIKGDNNNFFLYISELKSFITRSINHFFPFDEYAVTKNTSLYTLQNVHLIKDPTVKYKNVFFFGASLKLLGIAREEGEAMLATQFSGDILAANILCLGQWYEYFTESAYDLSQNVWPKKEFVFGNELIATWAIASGMDFYSAYPMTPASSLIDVVVTKISEDEKQMITDDGFQKSTEKIVWNLQKKSSVIFHQGEDEIAVSMSMLWAKFAGKRAMCGTSGGGFALMTESIGFSTIAELWGVYIFAQRDGPSTGTPTYTGQSDLNYALNASFGDVFPIVLAPSTFEEWYSLVGKALNRSDMYQHPVILMSDKQLSESYLAVDKNTLVAEPILRWKVENLTEGKMEGDYKRYAVSADGISPVLVPGTENGEFIATSYEHDEHGATTEDPIIKKQQQDKRFKKLETFVQQEFTDNFYGYEVINPEAKNFFVTMGVNRYVLQDFMDMNPGYWLIVIKVFQPFDMRLKTFLDQRVNTISKIIFVEMNTSGQLEQLVTNHCLLKAREWEGKISHIRKYTLYPIFAEDIIV